MSTPSDSVAQNLKAEILSGARYASIMKPAERRLRVTDLVERCLDIQIEATEEIFEIAYGDRLGRDYWRGWLADDFSNLYQFVRMLEIHSGKLRDIDYISRSLVLEAFSVAVRSRPEWLRNAEGKSEIPRQSNHPQLLAGWEICRGPAVDWLLQHPEFKDLVPPLMASVALKEAGHDDGKPELKRMTAQKMLCQEAFKTLYPGGIPGRVHISDQRLAEKIQNYIKETNRTPPSEDTILRAAGRKPTKRGPKRS